MNILQEYTLDFVKRNRRSSIAIMVALLLTVTMLSGLSGFFWTMYTDNIRLELKESGNWHGELFDDTYGRDLEQIENYASVEAVMVKGPWKVSRLESGNPRRQYLILRGANREYWESMPEKDLIIEGRIPSAEGEIALSKQYFDAYPETKLGDVLTFPTGERLLGGEVRDPSDAFSENETFRQTGTVSYTVVAKWDIATSSMVPAYTALGYLENSAVQPDEMITVYLRFHNMRDTYRELPALAASLGWETDEYGRYSLKYNSPYLARFLILPPNSKMDIKGVSGTAAFVLVFAAMVIGLFVLIIHNAFALSVNMRLSQLGILASIGASPKQIRKSVVYEGFFLLLIPLPLGILCGWAFDKLIFQLINNMSSLRAEEVIFTFGLPAILPTALLAFVTVWFSALIPAKRVSKMSPVEAIRQGGDGGKIKRIREKKHSLMQKFFGITGELASNALTARKKSYRAATISFTMAFLTLTSFQVILSCQLASEAVFPNQKEEYQQITFYLLDGQPANEALLQRMRRAEGVQSAVFFSETPHALWVPAEMASDSVEQVMGGFQGIVDAGKYSPIEQNGLYRLTVYTTGLDGKSFDEYCKSIGEEPAPYHEENGPVIFYNRTIDPIKYSKRNQAYMELLKVREGDTLHLSTKAYESDSDDGAYEFDLTIGRITDVLPRFQSFSSFTTCVLMPYDRLQKLSEHFYERRKLNVNNIKGIFVTDAQRDTDGFYDRVLEVSSSLTGIANEYYGSSDFEIINVKERHDSRENGYVLMKLIVNCISGLLMVIGMANVWSTIMNNLAQRRREFAMLRSMGMPPKGIRKMLLMEGVFFAFTPLLLSVVPFAGVLAAFLYLNEITLWEFLPFAPFGVTALFIALLFASTVGAYVVGERNIRKLDIVSALKEDRI